MANTSMSPDEVKRVARGLAVSPAERSWEESSNLHPCDERVGGGAASKGKTTKELHSPGKGRRGSGTPGKEA